MSEREFEPLHPRAIRIGLERVLENQAVRPREPLPLQHIYERIMVPKPFDRQEKERIKTWLNDFAEHNEEHEREAHLESYLRGGKS